MNDSGFVNGCRLPDDPFLGTINFDKIGQEFLNHFTGLAGLKPDEYVLDAGCGYGRMAAALSGYLIPEARYRGFDIRAKVIDWCRDSITKFYPNFIFDHVDVRNKHYAPQGEFSAAEFVFPYENETFDMVLLISVLTHMVPGDVKRYVSEASRVLKKGGRCFATFFIFEEIPAAMSKHRPDYLDFKYKFDENSYVIDSKNPEAAITFRESWVRTVFLENGFEIQEPLHYGSWTGRKPFISFQDILIAVKL